ncbi:MULTISPECIES: twin-arginine translocase subunit TatC [Calditerrivibrio]|uniref:Sec-independent protein translocase protein TatC n=1 Tax=Calditerrivibrio nitroreducens TaxID=477976 RepID=A0A2J6WGJ8_9BACT|nr:MAG: twin-arginine translocase subunit TatC [Calditerrivibrio nitroreducens]
MKPVDAEQPLMTHLEELRKRLIRIMIALTIVFSICYWKSVYLFQFIKKPLILFMPPNSSLSMLKLTEGFLTELKLSFMAAVFFAMPYILYELWKFIAPGLYTHERKYVSGFVISASFLFFFGSFFCYQFVLPIAFKFFLTYATDGITANLSLTWYLSFVVKLMLGFGVVFELPVIVFFLAKIGLVTEDMLKKYRGYSIVGIFIIAAILTPPDVVSQVLMAIPLLILYEISIFVAKIFGKKKGKDLSIYE